MIRTGNSPAGFSLIDVLMAVVILTILVTAFIHAHLISMANARQAEEYIAASRAARYMLETVTHDKFTALLTDAGEVRRSNGRYAFTTYQRRQPFVVYLNASPMDVVVDSPGGVTSTATTLYLADTDATDFLRTGMVLGYPQTMEKLVITAIATDVSGKTKLTVTRGASGTTAAAMLDGARLFPLERYLPGLKDEYAGEVIIITDETKAAADYGGDLSPQDGNPDGVTMFRQFPADLNDNGNTTDNEAHVLGDSSATRIPVGVVIRWQGRRGEERCEEWTIFGRY